jgi:signal recognition particle subunit SRP54
MVKIVQDELIRLMGPWTTRFIMYSPGPMVYAAGGFAGVGQDDDRGQISRYMRDKNNKKPLLVANDLQRPAAIDQLCTAGEQLGIAVYKEDGTKDAVRVATNGIK